MYLFEETKVDRSVGKIKDQLANLPATLEDITVRRLKAELGLQISKDTWQAAVAKAIADSEWHEAGHRLLRGQAYAQSFGIEAAA